MRRLHDKHDHQKITVKSHQNLRRLCQNTDHGVHNQVHHEIEQLKTIYRIVHFSLHIRGLFCLPL